MNKLRIIIAIMLCGLFGLSELSAQYEKEGVANTGEEGFYGQTRDYVNHYGQFVCHPRLSRFGELLTYPPYVTTDSVQHITQASAQIFGNLLDDGWCSPIISIGAEVSTNENDFTGATAYPLSPNIIYEDCFCDPHCNRNVFDLIVNGLAENVDYYFRTYVVTSCGTSYGDTVHFYTEYTPLDLVNGHTDSVMEHRAIVVASIAEGVAESATVCLFTNSSYTGIPICLSSSDFTVTDTNIIGKFTGLTLGTTYYARVTACDDHSTCDTVYTSFTTHSTCTVDQLLAHERGSGGILDSVSDRDGNWYEVVQIGSQCWLKENLKTTHSPSTGTDITQASQRYSSTGKIAKWYANNQTNYEAYGLLYNWCAALDTFNTAKTEIPTESKNNGWACDITGRRQGICPAGWHLPSDAEWTQMENHVVSGAYGTSWTAAPAFGTCVTANLPYNNAALSEGNNTYIAEMLSAAGYWTVWATAGTPGNTSSYRNITGFGAIPAGYFAKDKDKAQSAGINQYALFWTSTVIDDADGYGRELYYKLAGVPRMNLNKAAMATVRCVRDEGTKLGTAAAANITCSSIVVSVAVESGDAPEATAYVYTTSDYSGTCLSVPLAVSGTNLVGTIAGLKTNTHYYIRIISDLDTAVMDETTDLCTCDYYFLHKNETAYSSDKFVSVTDVDGNTYGVLQYGAQCWLRENVSTNTTPDGSSIALGAALNSGTAYRYYPNNSSSNAATYGQLYNWTAVMNGGTSTTANPSGVQGICPDGWHVPSLAEWTQFTTTINTSTYQCNSTAGNIAKALASDAGWNASSTACAPGNDQNLNNASRFNAFPAGKYSATDFGNDAYFWLATQKDGNNGYYVDIDFATATVATGNAAKSAGYSLRCVRDIEFELDTLIVDEIEEMTLTMHANAVVGTPVSGTLCASTSPDFDPAVTVCAAATITGDSIHGSIPGLHYNTRYYLRITGIDNYNQSRSVYGIDSLGNAPDHELTYCSSSVIYAHEAHTGDRIDSVMDHEGNWYEVVKIGDRCWLRENLRTTTSPSTGAYLIPDDDGIYQSHVSKEAHWYNNDSVTYNRYGLLYNWLAAMDTFNINYPEVANAALNEGYKWDAGWYYPFRQGICPTGWHIPTTEEMASLEIEAGMDAGTATTLKRGWGGTIAGLLTGGYDWPESNVDNAPGNYADPDRDALNLTIIPSGYFTNTFNAINEQAWLWCATQDECFQHAEHRAWQYDYNGIYRKLHEDISMKYDGMAVRCVRDPISEISPDIIGSDLCSGDSLVVNYAVSFAGATVTGYSWSVEGTASHSYTPSSTFKQKVTFTSTGTARVTCVVSYAGGSEPIVFDTVITNTPMGFASCQECELGKAYVGQALNVNTVYFYSLNPYHLVASIDLPEVGDAITLEPGQYITKAVSPQGCVLRDTIQILTTTTSCTGITSPKAGTAIAGDKFANKEWSSSAGQIEAVSDHEGNLYSVVQVGSHCWTKENLRATTSPSTGTSLLATGTMPDYTYSGKQARWVDNDSVWSTNKGFGLLYNWNAAVDTFNVAYSANECSISNEASNSIAPAFVQRRGICPEGWHIPSTSDIAELVLSQTDSVSCRLAANCAWTSSSLTNTPSDYIAVCHGSSHYSALPAGYYYDTFSGQGTQMTIWTIGQSSSSAYSSAIFNNTSSPEQTTVEKCYGLSVRCVRDAE